MAGSGTAHMRSGTQPLLSVEHLVVEFPSRRGQRVHAVSDVSIDVLAGETLGLVGESGCGKSSTAKAIVQAPRPTGGSVYFQGQDLTRLSGEELRRVRTQMQMIFQDPISSLNPRRRVGDIVGEPLAIWGVGDRAQREERVREVFEAVGLNYDSASQRRTHEFSGGQCQRISIARSLVLDPKLLICDEPVSSLDVSIQAQILNLLEETKVRYGLTLIFIAHDLAVVKNVSDRVVVMYLGKICEVVSADDLYEMPAHPYTNVLLSSIPVPDPSVRPGLDHRATGEPASPLAPPSGCRFRTRCPRSTGVCTAEEPTIRPISDGHFVACHHPVAPGARRIPLTSRGGTRG